MKMRRHQCVLHPDRGAVARCPVCRRFYCHECITEHEGQVLCRRCLTRQGEDSGSVRPGFGERYGSVVRLLVKPLLMVAGFIILWFIFVSVGSMLMSFPDSFFLSTSENSGKKGGASK